MCSMVHRCFHHHHHHHHLALANPLPSLLQSRPLLVLAFLFATCAHSRWGRTRTINTRAFSLHVNAIRLLTLRAPADGLLSRGSLLVVHLRSPRFQDAVLTSPL